MGIIRLGGEIKLHVGLDPRRLGLELCTEAHSTRLAPCWGERQAKRHDCEQRGDKGHEIHLSGMGTGACPTGTGLLKIGTQKLPSCFSWLAESAVTWATVKKRT